MPNFLFYKTWKPDWKKILMWLHSLTLWIRCKCILDDHIPGSLATEEKLLESNCSKDWCPFRNTCKEGLKDSLFSVPWKASITDLDKTMLILEDVVYYFYWSSNFELFEFYPANSVIENMLTQTIVMITYILSLISPPTPLRVL